MISTTVHRPTKEDLSRFATKEEPNLAFATLDAMIDDRFEQASREELRPAGWRPRSSAG